MSFVRRHWSVHEGHVNTLVSIRPALFLVLLFLSVRHLEAFEVLVQPTFVLKLVSVPSVVSMKSCLVYNTVNTPDAPDVGGKVARCVMTPKTTRRVYDPTVHVSIYPCEN